MVTAAIWAWVAVAARASYRDAIPVVLEFRFDSWRWLKLFAAIPYVPHGKLQSYVAVKIGDTKL